MPVSATRARLHVAGLSVFYLLSAALLAWAALSLADAWWQWQRQADYLERVSQRQRLLAANRRQLARYQDYLERAGRFVALADRVGMNPDHWSTYQVSRNEPVRFAQLQRLLGQVEDGPGYYFLGQRLEVRMASPVAAGTIPPEGAEAGPGTASGDVLLEIQGEFRVRQR